jgi:REP element-mobilizing transposase RayT
MQSKILLEPGRYYHVFNHAVEPELLFRAEIDYNNFISKYSKYLAPIVSTLAYCLMPNHFHLCIRIKDLDELTMLSPKYRLNKQIHSGIYYSFSHFFNSYAQFYNKKYQRMGGLFINNFKRKEILSDDSLLRLVCYIHSNPVEAKFTKSIDHWVYSSYLQIINKSDGIGIALLHEEVLRIFGDLENFQFVHNHPSRL